MEGAVGSRLFEACDGGVHCLLSGGEGASGQHLDSLGLTDFGAGIDHLLSSFEEFSSELSKVEDFPFNKWVPQSSYGPVNELLIWLSVLEDSLMKGMKWGLGAIAGSSSQWDGKDRVPLSHSEEGSGVGVIQYESHILGFATIVVSVTYGRRNAELPIQSILHERWAWVSESCGVIDDMLIHAAYYDRGRRQSNPTQERWQRR